MTKDSTKFSRRSVLVAAAGLALPSTVRAEAATVQDSKEDAMRLRFIFADQDFTARLENNPSARDLISLLPLDLTISDYSTNEKIAYLPRKLSEDGSGRFGDEAV